MPIPAVSWKVCACLTGLKHWGGWLMLVKGFYGRRGGCDSGCGGRLWWSDARLKARNLMVDRIQADTPLSPTRLHLGE